MFYPTFLCFFSQLPITSMGRSTICNQQPVKTTVHPANVTLDKISALLQLQLLLQQRRLAAFRERDNKKSK